MGRHRRLPRVAEKELAKLLGTLGFHDYASPLWSLATQAHPTGSDVAFKDVYARHVLEQAEVDPAVVAAGGGSLPSLPRMSRNLGNTRGTDSSRLLAGLDRRPSVVLLVATLDRATRELVGSLVDGLSRLGADAILVIATDAGSRSDPEPTARATYDYIDWRDRVPGDEAASARHLALFLHVSGAHAIVAIDSRLGRQAFGRYGLALKSVQRLFALFAVPEAGFFTDIYHLRLVAPHARILARSESEADVLRARLAGLDGPGVDAYPEKLEQIFGTRFDDPRSVASQTVCSSLLGRSQEERHPQVRPEGVASYDRDLTAAILFHRERELAVPALSSLRKMADRARRDGVRLEVRAIIDRGDDVTKRIVAEHGDFLDDVSDASFGSPALARNAAASTARGRFLAFLDGDDLWGADWLSRGLAAAASSPDRIWHPEALFAFWASDCDRTTGWLSSYMIQQSSDSPAFDKRDLLFENMWSVNAIALTDTYRRFPYRPDDWERQIGIEDWRWNLDTLGHGLSHAIVPDTVHLIRIKEGGSFGQLHEAKALLPFLG